MDRRSFLLASTLSLLASSSRAETREVFERRISGTLVIENPLGESLRDQRVWFYLPAQASSTQRLFAHNVSSPHRILTDPIGNNVVELIFENFSPYSTKAVGFSAQVRQYPAPLPAALPMEHPWFDSERYIETDDPAIKALGETLRRPETMTTARAIFDWVRSELRYAGFIADDLGAAYALRNRRGDCTEYAYLAVALARAAGIPARALGGYVATQDYKLRAADYHNWAEFYFDGAWQLIDPQKEHFLEGAQNYMVFRIISARIANSMGNAHRYATDGPLKVRTE